MKYLILCPEDKRIVHISNTIGYESNGNFILSSGIRVAKGISELIEVEEVPAGVKPEKYLYINGEFVENPEWNTSGDTDE